ncbi:MAG: MMPL family transporter, partial [Planctomycetota bacterium]|nr:MMPL family transporter [Planctomycetota bacterium]
LTDSLYERRDELKLADIRSAVHPFGIAVHRAAKENGEADIPAGLSGLKLIAFMSRRRMEQAKFNEHYVGQRGRFKGTMTQIDFVSTDDPFTRGSIRQFIELKEDVLTQARKFLPQDARLEVVGIGPTASIRDLKTVTDRDQRVVDALVLLGIFLILVALLRQVTIPVYLILTVFFSYLVTLGVTFTVFWSLDPSGFEGLDWKVPTFLFTILIAVGEDYNIFLMTRIREEQVIHGPVKGVAIALTKTGSIISSCGIIMAGTFSSLLAGTLAGMHQLGFALAFGVLLDTFVVRPILVPAFLVLYYEGRLGILKPAVVSNATGYQTSDEDSETQEYADGVNESEPAGLPPTFETRPET